jgi:hypothetical protein
MRLVVRSSVVQHGQPVQIPPPTYRWRLAARRLNLRTGLLQFPRKSA